MLKYLHILSESTATLALAALNIAVFATSGISELSNALILSGNFGETVAEPWRVASYMALHEKPVHLVVNIVLLLLAGAYYERRTSSLRLLTAYLAGGLFGGLLFAAASAISGNGAMTLCGASAAIISVICAASTDYRSKFKICKFPSISLVILLAITGIYGLFGSNPGGSLTHIGGIVTGVAIGSLAAPKQRTRQKPDKIVSKANTSGFSALSREERDILFNRNFPKR